MSEAEKTLSIKFVSDLSEVRDDLRNFQSEVANTTFPVGGGSASIPASGAPNRISDMPADFSALFSSRGRAPNLDFDEISPRMADLFIPSGISPEREYSLFGWRGRSAQRMLADQSDVPTLDAAGLGGGMMPPPRGMMMASGEGDGLGPVRPAWMNLTDDSAGQLPPPRGRSPIVDGELLGAGWAGRGGYGGGEPPFSPGAGDDEDYEYPYRSWSRSSRGRGGMGWMGRFAALEGVSAFSGLLNAQRESTIQRAMAAGDPQKLAEADIAERNRMAEAIPFGMGRLGLLLRDPDGSEELSVRQPFEDARLQDARGQVRFQAGLESTELARRAEAAALPEGSRQQFISQAEIHRQATYNENRDRANQLEDSEQQRFNKQQADDLAAESQRSPITKAEYDLRRKAEQQEHDRQNKIISDQRSKDDASADAIYNSDLRNDALARRAALDTQRMDRTASFMREWGFGDAAESYELRRRGEIAAAAEQDPDQKAAMQAASATAVSADAAVRGRARMFDDIQTENSIASSAAVGRGDTFEQQILHQQAANASDFYQQTTWPGRLNSFLRGEAALGALGQEQRREVSIANYASEGRSAVAEDEFSGDTRKALIDRSDVSLKESLARLGDVNGVQYQAEAPGLKKASSDELADTLKKFDDDQRAADAQMGWNVQISGEEAQGLHSSARADSIASSAFGRARRYWDRSGPGDMARANEELQVGVNEEKGLLRGWDEEEQRGAHGIGPGIAAFGVPRFESSYATMMMRDRRAGRERAAKDEHDLQSGFANIPHGPMGGGGKNDVVVKALEAVATRVEKAIDMLVHRMGGGA